jgi:hypothetical protein
VNRMAIAAGQYQNDTSDRGDHSWRQRPNYSRT